MRRKVVNLRSVLGIIVTAVQAGRSVYHTSMVGQPGGRVKHKVCQHRTMAAPKGFMPVYGISDSSRVAVRGPSKHRQRGYPPWYRAPGEPGPTDPVPGPLVEVRAPGCGRGIQPAFRFHPRLVSCFPGGRHGPSLRLHPSCAIGIPSIKAYLCPHPIHRRSPSSTVSPPTSLPSDSADLHSGNTTALASTFSSLFLELSARTTGYGQMSYDSKRPDATPPAASQGELTRQAPGNLLQTFHRV